MYRPILTSLIVGLLAIHAWQTTTTKARHTSAVSDQESLAKPRLVVQTSHAAAVNAVTFSPDGAVAFTASADGSACLWEVKGGRQLRCLAKQESGITHVDYSTDGSLVLTALERGGVVRLWNPRTGELVIQFAHEGTDKTLQFASFSPDARYVLTGGSFNTVNLWDTQTGKLARSLVPDVEIVKHDIPNYDNPFAFPDAGAFSADGKQIVVGGSNGVAHFWDVDSGKYTKALAAFPAAIHTIAFSPDGKMILAGGSDAGDAQRAVGAVLWTIETGKLERTFKHDQVVTALGFSSDGHTIFTSSDGAADQGEGYVRLWDVATGTQLRSFKPKTGTSVGHGAVISKDGHSLLVSEYGAAKVWDAATGEMKQELASYSEPVINVRFTPDGKYLMIKGADISLWSLEQGRLLWREFNGGRGHNLNFAPDGKTFVAGSGYFDSATGQPISENKFATKDTYAQVSDMSTDGRLVVTALRGNASSSEIDKPDGVAIWDAATGQILRRLSGLDNKAVNTVKFSTDGKRILTSGADSVARLWDVESASELKQFKMDDETGPVYSTRAELSPDGKMVLTVGSLEHQATLWDAETGQLLFELKGNTSSIESAIFAPDGKTVITADDVVAITWDTKTGAEVRRIGGWSGQVNSMAFSPDGRFFVTGGQDGTTRLWVRDTDQELCRIQSFDVVLGANADKGDQGWAVAAPDGRFDSNTLSDIRGMHWVLPDDPMHALPLETFLRDYYQPGLLARIYAGDPLATLADLSRLNRVQPSVKIVDIKSEPPTLPDAIADQVTVTVEVANQVATQASDADTAKKLESGVFDVRLFRDGQMVGHAPEGDGAVKLDANGRAQLTFSHIRLSHRSFKKVEFAAYAFNVDRVKSATDRRNYDLPQSFKWDRGFAYVISVGVNGYQRDSLDLRYAANDARQMQEVVPALLRDRGAYKVVPVPLVSDYEVHMPDGRVVPAQEATLEELKTGNKVFTADQATKENVHAVLDVLAGKTEAGERLKNIPNADQLKVAGPDDLVLLTFSSHGYADTGGVFYVIPSDTGTGKLLSPEFLAHCISSDELGLWLRDVDAGEMTLIVDACHSAAAVAGSDFKPGPMGNRGFGQLAYDKGMRVLTATQTDNVALEANQVKQGLLTYALIQNGLKEEKANYLPHDEKITWAEWLNYAVVQVPGLYAEIRTGREGKALVEEERAGVTNPKLQQPSLFDFARRRRDVLLINNF